MHRNWEKIKDIYIFRGGNTEFELECRKSGNICVQKNQQNSISGIMRGNWGKCGTRNYSIQNETFECRSKIDHTRDPAFLASKFVFGFVPGEKSNEEHM